MPSCLAGGLPVASRRRPLVALLLRHVLPCSRSACSNPIHTDFAHCTSLRVGLGGGGTVLGEVAGLGSPAGGAPATRNRYTTTTNNRHMQATTDLEEEACLELHQGQADQVPGQCVTVSCFLFAVVFAWKTARGGGSTGAAGADVGGGSLLASWQVCVSHKLSFCLL